jgi:hypothetical protein
MVVTLITTPRRCGHFSRSGALDSFRSLRFLQVLYFDPRLRIWLIVNERVCWTLTLTLATGHFDASARRDSVVGGRRRSNGVELAILMPANASIFG